MPTLPTAPPPVPPQSVPPIEGLDRAFQQLEDAAGTQNDERPSLFSKPWWLFFNALRETLEALLLYVISIADLVIVTVKGVLVPGARQATSDLKGDNLNLNMFSGEADPLAAAITFLSVDGGTLRITSPYTVSSDVTIPVSVGLHIAQGGMFTITPGVKMIIGGPLDAGLYQIFSGGTVYFFGGVVAAEVYPQWFGALGDGKAMGVHGNSGDTTLPIAGNNPFLAGDPIIIKGGGAAGGLLVTTVTAIAGDGSTVTIATPLVTTLSINAAAYNHDDSDALNAWSASVRAGTLASPQAGYDLQSGYGTSKLYVPKGTYIVASRPIQFYSSTQIMGSGASPLESGVILQADLTIPAIQVLCWSADPDGRLFNAATGGTIRDLNLRSSYIDDSFQTPMIQFMPSPVVISDFEIDHVYCGPHTTGPVIQTGYATTAVGALVPGDTSMVLADASFFWNGWGGTTGKTATIEGAGAAGADLVVTFSSGGRNLANVDDPPNTAFTFTPAIVTSVTDPRVWQTTEVVNPLKISRVEMDVGCRLLDLRFGTAGGADSGAAGDVWVSDCQIFQGRYGGIYAECGPINVRVTRTKFHYVGACFSAGVQGTCIYIKDVTGSQASIIEITGNTFQRDLATTLGGRFFFDGCGNVLMQNNVLDNICDSGDTDKGFYCSNVPVVKFQNNTVLMKNIISDVTNARWMLFTGPTDYVPLSVVITANQFMNTSGVTLPFLFNFDWPEFNTSAAECVAVVRDNHYYGPFGAIAGSNLANVNVRAMFDSDLVDRVGTEAPTVADTYWRVGDFVRNSAPGEGLPGGWTCITAGSPGTWYPVSLLPDSTKSGRFQWTNGDTLEWRKVDLANGGSVAATGLVAGDFLRWSGSAVVGAAAPGFANPMTTLGDVIYGGAAGAPTRLPGNATTTREFYASTGAAGVATAPALVTLVAGDVPASVRAPTTQTVVTGSRTVGTAYQNTGSTTMTVTYTLNVTSAGVAQVFVDASATPTTLVAQSDNTGSISGHFPITFDVLPGSYYKAVQGSGTVSTYCVVEWK